MDMQFQPQHLVGKTQKNIWTCLDIGGIQKQYTDVHAQAWKN